MTVPGIVPPKVKGSHRRLVDDAFATAFPHWDRISPFDPVKLVAEGLVGALEAAERRERRLVESALDAMPALFGFEPKSARLPLVLFALRPPERVRVPVALGGRGTMRLRCGEKTWVLFPQEGAELSPVLVRQTSRLGNRASLTLVTRGPLPELSIVFVPESEVHPRRVLEILVTAPGNAPSTAKDFVIADGTDGFSGFGTLRLRRRDGRPVASEAGTVEVSLGTDGPLGGNLLANVVACGVGHRVEELSLGALDGEAWESRPLPERLVGAPDRVLVRYPDGRRRELLRLAEEALLARDSAEYEREGYLYDGTRHRLVFPNADVLVGEWNGGVELIVPEGILLPEETGVPEGVEVALGDASAVVESLEPVALLAPAILRETGDRFLARFYESLRQLPSRTAGPLLPRPSELAGMVVAAVPALRAAEARLEGNRVTLFALATDPHATDAFRIEPGTAALAKRALEAELPLTHELTLVPFEQRPLAVAVRLELLLRDERAVELDEKAVGPRVRAALEETLLPPPFGDALANSARSTDQLECVVLAKLARHFEPGEVASIRLTFRDAKGAFVETVTRAAGECPVLDIQLSVERRLAGGR